MELPSIGTHCFFSSCHQLDFLPMKCDACENQFCKDHIRYTDHNCESSYKKDVQVPVCPLCNKPVPVKRGELPDIKVGEHIDRDCRSEPAQKQRKAYTSRCSAARCKQKELMPVICPQCGLNFCLRHRHPQDHDCNRGQKTHGRISQPGMAAIMRSQQVAKTQPFTSRTAPQQSTMNQLGRNLAMERENRVSARPPVSQQVQGNLTEDEALARAIQLSLEQDAASNQDKDNRNTNRTQSQRRTQAKKENDSCAIA